MLCARFGVGPPGFVVCAILVSDHPISEVATPFLKESISRLIIMVRYL